MVKLDTTNTDLRREKIGYNKWVVTVLPNGFRSKYGLITDSQLIYEAFDSNDDDVIDEAKQKIINLICY